MSNYKQFFKQEIFDIGIENGFIYINIGTVGMLLWFLMLFLIFAFMTGSIVVDFSPMIEYLRELM